MAARKSRLDKLLKCQRNEITFVYIKVFLTAGHFVTLPSCYLHSFGQFPSNINSRLLQTLTSDTRTASAAKVFSQRKSLHKYCRNIIQEYSLRICYIQSQKAVK